MKTAEQWNQELGAGTYSQTSLKDFIRAVQADALRSAANVCERRYMGDNNREDMEARRCAEAVRALMPRDV